MTADQLGHAGGVREYAQGGEVSGEERSRSRDCEWGHADREVSLST